jgi:ADP-ribose pyrophosphatase YjhB (NUDIX family)
MAKPILVTSAIIIEDRNILLVQNQKDPKKAYGFPGGVGAWETVSDPKEAVIKEVMDDMGCEFNGSFFTYGFRDGETPIVTLFFLGTIKGQPHPVCKNIIDVKYFPIEEARKMELAYEHNAILEKYLSTSS